MVFLYFLLRKVEGHMITITPPVQEFTGCHVLTLSLINLTDKGFIKVFGWFLGVFFFSPCIFPIYFMHWWLWNWLVNSRCFSGAIKHEGKTTSFLLGVIPVSAGQGELAHSCPIPWDQIKNWPPLTVKRTLQRLVSQDTSPQATDMPLQPPLWTH